MKIAITADLHLTTRDQHPERFETLERILADLQVREVKTLIIAGDLFDASRQSYAEFEQLCRDQEHRECQIILIPGNHDPAIDERKIVVDNVQIFNSASLQQFEGRPILFLPYAGTQTMGEALVPLADLLFPDEWVLVGHGDWAEGLRTPNPTEPGVYMPLTRKDIELFRPARVFLGHIHLPMDAAPVHYAGSPCGLDITETGRRRYLLYDTESNHVESVPVTVPILFYDETFTIMPTEDESAYLKAQIESRQRAWGLTPEERARTQLRVKVRGYSADRAALQRVLQEAFEDYAFYNGRPPDIDEVFSSDDVERQYIVEQVRESLGSLTTPDGPDDPDRDDILLQAMRIIYGE